MPNKILRLLFFVLTGFCMHANPTQAFESQAGAFSIWMPASPATEIVDHKSIVGAVRETTYSLKTTVDELTVSFTEMPRTGLFFKSHASLLTAAEKGFIKETGAQIRGRREITFAGTPGIELDIEMPAKTQTTAPKGTARFYLVGKILYVLFGTTTHETEGNPKIKEFLDSFKLTN